MDQVDRPDPKKADVQYSNDPSSTLDLTRKHRRAALNLSAGHFRSAKRLHRAYTVLGLAAAAMSATTATSLLADRGGDPNDQLQAVAAILAAASAVITAALAFLRLGERSSEHKEWGARFAALRDAADVLILRIDQDPESGSGASSTRLLDDVAELGREISDAVLSAPDIREADYRAVRRDEA